MVKSNTRGYLSYAATSQPNSRTTQLFVNYANNSNLDSDGFAPFGRVISGMSVVDAIYSGYVQEPRQVISLPFRNRASLSLHFLQYLITREGNEYLEENFPLLDYIITARIIE